MTYEQIEAWLEARGVGCCEGSVCLADHDDQKFLYKTPAEQQEILQFVREHLSVFDREREISSFYPWFDQFGSLVDKRDDAFVAHEVLESIKVFVRAKQFQDDPRVEPILEMLARAKAWATTTAALNVTKKTRDRVAFAKKFLGLLDAYERNEHGNAIDGESYEEWARRAYGDDPSTLDYVLRSASNG